MNYRRSHYLEHLISYSKKDTIHQINFYLILTPGSRKRLGYYVLLWYTVKEDSLNNNKKILEVC